MTGELRQAIEHNQLSLHFQPKIDLNTMRVIGAEALSRWHHPDHGFIPPDEFILHAEQTGLIGPLTHWVFATALSQLKDWQDRGHDLSMAINISARNLHDEGLPDLITRLVSDWQVGLDRLTLEITESAIMSDPEASLRVVKRLHSLGVRLAVDDFGTGHSSLSYLKSWEDEEVRLINARALAFYREAVGSDQAVIDIAWANIYGKGDYIMPHSHTRAAASLVYCVDQGDPDELDPNGGLLCFVDPRFPDCCQIEPHHMTNPLKPTLVPGAMLLFPGQMVHFVTPYGGGRPRITLAWNINQQAIPGSPLEPFEGKT